MSSVRGLKRRWRWRDKEREREGGGREKERRGGDRETDRQTDRQRERKSKRNIECARERVLDIRERREMGNIRYEEEVERDEEY